MRTQRTLRNRPSEDSLSTLGLAKSVRGQGSASLYRFTSVKNNEPFIDSLSQLSASSSVIALPKSRIRRGRTRLDDSTDSAFCVDVQNGSVSDSSSFETGRRTLDRAIDSLATIPEMTTMKIAQNLVDGGALASISLNNLMEDRITDGKQVPSKGQAERRRAGRRGKGPQVSNGLVQNLKPGQKPTTRSRHPARKTVSFAAMDVLGSMFSTLAVQRTTTEREDHYDAKTRSGESPSNSLQLLNRTRRMRDKPSRTGLIAFMERLSLVDQPKSEPYEGRSQSAPNPVPTEISVSQLNSPDKRSSRGKRCARVQQESPLSFNKPVSRKRQDSKRTPGKGLVVVACSADTHDNADREMGAIKALALDLAPPGDFELSVCSISESSLIDDENMVSSDPRTPESSQQVQTESQRGLGDLIEAPEEYATETRAQGRDILLTGSRDQSEVVVEFLHVFSSLATGKVSENSPMLEEGHDEQEGETAADMNENTTLLDDDPSNIEKSDDDTSGDKYDQVEKIVAQLNYGEHDTPVIPMDLDDDDQARSVDTNSSSVSTQDRPERPNEVTHQSYDNTATRFHDRQSPARGLCFRTPLADKQLFGGRPERAETARRSQRDVVAPRCFGFSPAVDDNVMMIHETKAVHEPGIKKPSEICCSKMEKELVVRVESVHASLDPAVPVNQASTVVDIKQNTGASKEARNTHFNKESTSAERVPRRSKRIVAAPRRFGFSPTEINVDLVHGMPSAGSDSGRTSRVEELEETESVIEATEFLEGYHLKVPPGQTDVPGSCLLMRSPLRQGRPSEPVAEDTSSEEELVAQLRSERTLASARSVALNPTQLTDVSKNGTIDSPEGEKTATMESSDTFVESSEKTVRTSKRPVRPPCRFGFVQDDTASSGKTEPKKRVVSKTNVKAQNMNFRSVSSQCDRVVAETSMRRDVDPQEKSTHSGKSVKHEDSPSKVNGPKSASETLSERENFESSWTSTEIRQLNAAHKKADPTMDIFWEQVASNVDGKSAVECRQQWLAMIRTPAVKRARPLKQQAKMKTFQATDNRDQDDVFDSTPMRYLVNHGSSEGSRLLDVPVEMNWGSAIKIDGSSKDARLTSFIPSIECGILSGAAAPKPGFKSYLVNMRRDYLQSVKEMNKKARKKQGRSDKTSQRVLSETMYDEDVDMNVRLTPRGTINVKATHVEDDFWSEMYSDYGSDDDEP